MARVSGRRRCGEAMREEEKQMCDPLSALRIQNRIEKEGLVVKEGRLRGGVKLWGVALLLGMLMSLGCATTEEVKIERARHGNLLRVGDVSERDFNEDGESDHWVIREGDRVVREERDLNFDGLVDVYMYYDETGVLAEEEMDLDVDGKIDVVSYYKGGKLNKKQLSIGFEGKLTVMKYYDVDGALSRVERDENDDGRVDTWEYYQDNKKIRTGRDLDKDGSPDVFDEVEE